MAKSTRATIGTNKKVTGNKSFEGEVINVTSKKSFE